MSLESEVLPNRAEAREERLDAFAISKPTYPTLAFMCGLVAVLGPIVQACSGFDEHLFDVRQFRDVGLGDWSVTILRGTGQERSTRRKNPWLRPCPAASATGCPVPRRAHRPPATTDSARRAASRTFHRDARCCLACAVRPSRDGHSRCQTCHTSGEWSRRSRPHRVRTVVPRCRAGSG